MALKHILSVDPGESSGVAIIDYKGNAMMLSTVKEDKFNETVREVFEEYEIDRIVAEDFQLYYHKAKQQSGSKLVTVRILGALKMVADLHGIPMVLQPANKLAIARKWSKTGRPNKHDNNHFIDAYNHGFYWLVKNGRVQPRNESH